MKKIFLGTFMGTIGIYAEPLEGCPEITEDDEKLLHEEFKEVTKTRLPVDPELAKILGIATETYLKS